MTLSAIFFVGQVAIVRHLSRDFHFVEISFFRAIFGVVVMLPWLMRYGLTVLRTTHTAAYMGRGFFSTAAMYGWFGGIALIPIADATAISFTFPLFVALFAVLLLKEPARVERWIALGIGFAGTMIVVRPGFEEVNHGVFMVIAAGLCIGLSAVVLKIALRTDTPDTATIYQSIWMLPFAAVGAVFVWVWPTPEQWLWAAALGLCSTWAQRLYSRAFAIGDISAVMPFDFTRLPFAVILGWALFAEVPDLWTLVGGVVIFAGTIYAGHGESRIRRRKPA